MLALEVGQTLFKPALEVLMSPPLFLSYTGRIRFFYPQDLQLFTCRSFGSEF
jgi:hypothetical protein